MTTFLTVDQSCDMLITDYAYWVPKQYWSGSPVNQASIQCWADVGPILLVFWSSHSHNQLTKKVSELSWTPLTNPSGSAHVVYSELGNKTTISYLSVQQSKLPSPQCSG